MSENKDAEMKKQEREQRQTKKEMFMMQIIK